MWVSYLRCKLVYYKFPFSMMKCSSISRRQEVVSHETIWNVLKEWLNPSLFKLLKEWLNPSPSNISNLLLQVLSISLYSLPKSPLISLCNYRFITIFYSLILPVPYCLSNYQFRKSRNGRAQSIIDHSLALLLEY